MRLEFSPAQFFATLTKGSLPLTQLCLDARMSPNTIDTKDTPALLYAARTRHADIVR